MMNNQRRGARTLVVGLFCLGGWLGFSGVSVLMAADTIALVAEQNGNLDRLDITTGAVSLIKAGVVPYVGLGYNADESVLYGITGRIQTPTSLVTINPSNGVATLVGPNNVDLAGFTDLAGRLFGIDVSDNLYQVNPTTGVATLVGPTGLPALTPGFDNSLASDGTTLYYTLALNGGNTTLYRIDPLTGTATIIGSLGYDLIEGSVFAGPTFETGSSMASMAARRRCSSIARAAR